MRILQSPDNQELATFVYEAHSEGDLVTIHATCRVEYTGQREGKIDEGDRVIVCKRDGAIAVHRPTGARAVARQGIGSSLETILRDDFVRIYSAKGRAERLRVDILDSSVVIRQDAVDNAILEENQTEKQMHDYILSNPDGIEEGLRIIEHERQTPHGRVDFFAADAEGNNIILEIKQPVAQYSHVDQLQRYISYFNELDETAMRGMLVAPKIGSRVKRLLRSQNLEWKQLKKYRSSDTSPSQTSISEWK